MTRLAPRFIALLSLSLGTTTCASQQASLQRGVPTHAPLANNVAATASRVPATPAPSPAAAQSPMPPKPPAPSPSFALRLAGQVRLDPAPLVASGLAELTAGGARLLSDHGAGLISDKGAGLISDKGAGLISEKGLGLLANNGGNVIANNGAGATGVSKTFKLLQAASGAASPAPASGVPIAGLAVVGIDMLTGKQVTPIVPTDAQGYYELGFTAQPPANVGVLAVVPDAQQDVGRVYGTLVTPKTDASVVTTDATGAVAGFVLSVLPGRLQPVLDARENGTTAADYIEKNVEPTGHLLLQAMDIALAHADAAKLKAADQNGSLGFGISQRIVAFVDFNQDHYAKLIAFADGIRAYGMHLQPAVPDLLDQVLVAMRQLDNNQAVADLLMKYGMSPADAWGKSEDANALGTEVTQDIGAAALAHQAEVLAPLAPLGVTVPGQ